MDINIITASGMIIFASKTSLFISLNPHVAGNILPKFSKNLGSKLTGNMIPASIMDGRKINCDTIVSFDGLLIKRPKAVPTNKLTIIKIAPSGAFAIK